MSEENVEITRHVHEAFNRRDVDALVALLDPDVEWIPILATLEGRVYRGHADVRRWVEELDTDWEYFETCPEEFRDLGDRVLILGHWRARGRVSGVELENQSGSWLVDLKEGRIVRQQTYTDPAEALKAAGIAEEPGRPQAGRTAKEG
jgi:ketosteroid isomerase-like protein